MEKRMSRISGFLEKHVAERYSVSVPEARAALLYLSGDEKTRLARAVRWLGKTGERTRLGVILAAALATGLGREAGIEASALIPIVLVSGGGMAAIFLDRSARAGLGLRQKVADRLEQFKSEGWDAEKVMAHAEETGAPPEAKSDLESWGRDRRAKAMRDIRAAARQPGNAS
jgi:hypothetical protein